MHDEREDGLPLVVVEAADCTAWTAADPRAVDAFAVANLRMCQEFAERKPEAEWLTAMVTAARSWVRHRGLVAS